MTSLKTRCFTASNRTTHLVHRGEMSDFLDGRTPTYDLVFTSPPYEAKRTYGIDFNIQGEDWVRWCLPRYERCLEECSGLVAWVVSGGQRKYNYTGVEHLLIADLKRKGYNMRKPLLYHRHGIPGSGSKDYLKDCYETIVCFQRKGGRLPWAEPTAMGHPPKYPTGGGMTHHMKSGRKVSKLPGARMEDGTLSQQGYSAPQLANPGNVVGIGKSVGGGKMGSKIAHKGEASFPEWLAEFMIRTFCPPGGIVLDPFCGTGTTAAVALKHGRCGVSVDIRECACEWTMDRLKEADAGE